MLLRLRWAVADFCGTRLGSLLTYVAVVSAFVCFAAWGGWVILHAALNVAGGIVVDRSAERSSGSVTVTQSSWVERLQTHRSGTRSPVKAAKARRTPHPPKVAMADFSVSSAMMMTARPIVKAKVAFTAPLRPSLRRLVFPDQHSHDTRKFRARSEPMSRLCGSPAKLYVYDRHSGEPADMKDIEGQPYSRLPNANAFRTKYDESCRCSPQPWEQQSLDLHRMYALEAAVKKAIRTPGPSLQP